MEVKLQVKPCSLKEANAFIIKNHRHHDKVSGHKFSISVYADDEMVGIACVGKPVNRYLDNGKTLEVTRLCTDGTYNACSILYSRCARIAKDMGYEKIITYILNTENGTSLKASGWRCEDNNCGGGSWSSSKRHREVVEYTLFGEKVKYPTQKKQRWVKLL